MGRPEFKDNHAFTFYDQKKFPKLSFSNGDEPVRAEKIDDWLTEIEMAFLQGNPMTGLTT